MAEQPARPTTDSRRAYLDVPYSEKDDAKKLGARWDPAAKRWYGPRPLPARLERWAARPDVPELLPGEDRGFGDGLFVDMVPRSCWFTNVRTCVSEQDWERLRRMITRRASHRCEICGASEDRAATRWLEAHERWSYDVVNRVQSLRRLICLCSACHLTTHIGYANVTGRADQAVAHLGAVTGMTPAEIDRHIDQANSTWIARSALTWTLDLTMLTDAGITLRRPERAEERPAAADRALQEARRNEVPVRPVEPEPEPTKIPPLPAGTHTDAPARLAPPTRGW